MPKEKGQKRKPNHFAISSLCFQMDLNGISIISLSLNAKKLPSNPVVHSKQMVPNMVT